MTAFGNIPTTYVGTRFRSRLEARWAAFFDLVKWQWDYEPFDLGGYIPDFILSCAADGQPPVLVEVKPALTTDELKGYAERIVLSGWNQHELVILGTRVFPSDVLGVLGDNLDVAAGGPLALDQGVCFRCISCGGISLRSDSYAHRCRACGEVEGHVGGLEDGELDDLWRAAGNRVQWRAE